MTVRQNRLSEPAYPSDYVYPSDKDYPLNEDWEAGPIALLDTSEGLFNQAWHLEYNATGTVPYNPDMMQYDGVSGYYDSTITTSGNKFTLVVRFNQPSFTGNSLKYIFRANQNVGDERCTLVAWSNDHADPDFAGTILAIVENTAGTRIAQLLTPPIYFDGDDHVLFFSFDGDAGVATYVIDEINVDDLSNPYRVAPTTGTLPSGAGTDVYVGNDGLGSFYEGQLGYVGYKDAYLTNWSDFMDGNQPKLLDTATWSEWFGQPAYFHDIGDMVLNLGTEGAMTKNGTITQVPADPIPGDVQGFKVTPEDTGDPVNVLSGVNSVQCALAFDQNAHVTIAWIDSVGAMHLYWYDTTVGNWVVTNYGSGFAGVGLTLDDKRFRQTGASDILLWYTLPVSGHHEIYTREQRNRYAEEFPMDPGLAVWPYFKKLGMAKELRVQMEMTNVGPP